MKSITITLKQLQLHHFLQLVNKSLLILVFSISILICRAGGPSDIPVTNNEGLISQIMISVSGHNLLLSWQVDKSAFNYYEVEKSTDGTNFSTIGLVLDAPENSNTCLFKEKKPGTFQTVSIWYRIKGILKNGNIIYSNSSSYRETESVLPASTHIFSPNPFSNSGVVRYYSDQVGFVVLKLQNAAGETLLSKQSVLNKGYNTIQVDGLSSISSGVYVARLIINGTVMVNQKVVKE